MPGHRRANSVRDAFPPVCALCVVTCVCVCERVFVDYCLYQVSWVSFVCYRSYSSIVLLQECQSCVQWTNVAIRMNGFYSIRSLFGSDQTPVLHCCLQNRWSFCLTEFIECKHFQFQLLIGDEANGNGLRWGSSCKSLYFFFFVFSLFRFGLFWLSEWLLKTRRLHKSYRISRVISVSFLLISVIKGNSSICSQLALIIAGWFVRSTMSLFLWQPFLGTLCVREEKKRKQRS